MKFRNLIVVGLIGLVTLSSAGYVNNYFEVSKNLDIFATLFKEINTYYVDDIEPSKLMRTGIDAMLNSLDPYTNFISEAEIEDHRFQTTGKYGGIGSLIRKSGDKILIAEPYEGCPAHKSGLMAGDELLEVGGKEVAGKTTEQISKILKGQPGTEVKVLIKRPGTAENIEKKIEREEIKIKNVPHYGMVDENTGYIKLTQFTEKSGKNVREALVELKKDPKLKYLVFDLRGNPGGLLTESVNVANVFIKKGQEVVSTKGKIKEWDKTYKTLNTAVDEEIPLVILTNKGSASASEIVSGVVQDLDRGVIIGKQTFGKGLVQTTRPLTYNSQLKVTTAKYYVPSGRCIQAIDYSDKDKDGEATKIPDSLLTAFKTSNGREVYDGRGVAPDITVKQESLAKVTGSLLKNQLFFKYVIDYRLKHDSIAPVKEFTITDAEFESFVAYLEGKEYDYTTKSEKLLDKLTESSKSEKYFDAIEQDLLALQEKMMHDKKQDLYKHQEEIRQILKEEIVSRYYYQKGRIEASLESDPVILESIKLFKDMDRYKKILNPNN